jgi:N-acetylglutamate synthase/N-acetylornithine aminotransferase
MGEILYAKAGEPIAKKARKELARILRNEDVPTHVQTKSGTASGQHFCCDCGEPMANNMQAYTHSLAHPKHRLAWWTGSNVEES